ncbi:UNVERIFIED_CONTAM: hypothetical protein FKN15_002109 [Acipenser sinensis]
MKALEPKRLSTRPGFLQCYCSTLVFQTAGALQQQAEVWRERVSESRSASKVKAGARSPAQSSPRTPSGRHTPTPAFQDNASWSSTDGFRPIPHSGERELERQHQGRENTHSSRPPSRGPSPHHSGSRFRSSSLGEALVVNGGQRFQAVASHSACSNPTLLNFHSGALITVLVPVPRNGWLYGREEGSAR